ncbi:GNAT family N-acetyltransferase [Lutibacter sp.]|uniref:GNAT family N-acetyltransferase n=1 Tax=Lutibacter sp. TaxID=1925666 RepID=UPI002733FC5E|nr:GNAT family N-acetyltransferase [Lutibacter sp.]MDP3314306.1 GNAT family N-acetyltransferase [Lutibacter sp.]
MIFREATEEDIDNYMIVRMAVKENVLNNQALVTRGDNVDYLTKYGKGWVCEIDNKIVGFSIVGLIQRNVWALFVLPKFEGVGIGLKLHDIMLNWYFSQTNEKIWLGTEQKTKAETFYKNRGWIQVGMHGDDEIKFEMTFNDWKKYNN